MLHHPGILVGPQQRGDKITTSPKEGGNATSPLHSRGSPTKGGQNHSAPERGRKCYITPAFSGVPNKGG